MRIGLPGIAAWLPTAAIALSVMSATFAEAAAATPDIIERVKPSIVSIGTFQKTRSPAFSFRGTGFVVGDGTLVATNAHVLPESLQTDKGEALLVLVAVPGGKEPQPREARRVGEDKDHDVALLRISGSPLKALALGASGSVREGQTYAFTGFPIGHVLGFFPVTHRAMISSINPVVLPSASARQLNERAIRRIQSGAFSVFQLDATAYPGNSGSPLYDAETGDVVGIINMVFVKGTKETALTQPSGISFAIPAQHLHELLRNVR